MNVLKFSLLFLLCSIVLSLVGSYVTTVFNLFGASLNYVTTGYLGTVLSSIIGWIGWFLDTLFLSEGFTYTTYYGGIVLNNFSWLFTCVRVIFGVSVVTIIITLIIER